MSIAVCIKQVPATQDAKMDPEKGTLIREGAAMAINPYDLFAIEAALRLKDQLDASVTAFTMGPPSAKSVLIDAFAMGVDSGVLVSDPAFAGADVLATSYTLSQAIMSRGRFKLIVCGRQTTDGDTAQVGPAIAAHLGLPCLCWVQKIIQADDASLTAVQSMTDCEAVARITLPCIICVDKEIAKPRLPGLKAKLDARKKEITVMTLADMRDKSPENYGLDGSPTRVEKIYPPTRAAIGKRIQGTPDQITDNILEKLLAARDRLYGSKVWNT